MEGLRRSMSGVFTPRKKTPPPPTKGASPPPPPPPPDGDEQRPTFSEPPPPEAAKLLGYNWRQLYSLQQHGANAGTFYARVQFESRTLVVAETSAGEILGGYTSGLAPGASANNYFMMCSESSIAMGGGGGSFGFFLDDDFSRGSSGPSETYGNPPLAASSEFDVVNFECWGFTTHVDADAAAKEDRCRVGRPRPVVALLS
ncbi:hypothetical protein JL720_15619 [Aureococcus anophagefferens]|nr:hypothetical protein JL720_15619 [Aureococcus anophagefferens]